MVASLVRLGFDDPEAVAADLEALGAWPPRAAAGGRRLLEELGASANPTLATRALATGAIHFSPPLVITAEELREAHDALAHALDEVAAA